MLITLLEGVWSLNSKYKDIEESFTPKIIANLMFKDQINKRIKVSYGLIAEKQIELAEFKEAVKRYSDLTDELKDVDEKFKLIKYKYVRFIAIYKYRRTRRRILRDLEKNRIIMDNFDRNELSLLEKEHLKLLEAKCKIKKDMSNLETNLYNALRDGGSRKCSRNKRRIFNDACRLYEQIKINMIENI